VGVQAPLIVVEATAGDGDPVLVEDVYLEEANRRAALGEGLGLTHEVEIVPAFVLGDIVVPRAIDGVLSRVTKPGVAGHGERPATATALTRLHAPTGPEVSTRVLPVAVRVVLTLGHAGRIDDDLGAQTTQVEGPLVVGAVTTSPTMGGAGGKIESGFDPLYEDVGLLETVITRTDSNGLTGTREDPDGDVPLEALAKAQLLGALGQSVGGRRHESHE